MSNDPSVSAASRRSLTEWNVLDALRAHRYDYNNKGGKPDDPGWHACSCGWEGYWCDFQPHVAEQIMVALSGLFVADANERVKQARLKAMRDA